MNDLVIEQLTPADASTLLGLLTADDRDYRQYFIPFLTDIMNLEERLSSVSEDRYWGLWLGGMLIGFFMMRGFDEGFQRPSFGVYIASAYSGKGLLKLALEYAMSWCRLNGIKVMMLKVHPDNKRGRQAYEKAGFKFVEVCPRTGHAIMEKRWDEDE